LLGKKGNKKRWNWKKKRKKRDENNPSKSERKKLIEEPAGKSSTGSDRRSKY